MKTIVKVIQRQYVWDLFVRLFHWSLVIAFSAAFYSHSSEWDRPLHVKAGYAVGGLLVARIIWGFMKTGYANFHTFPLNPLDAVKYAWGIVHGHAKRFIGHNPAGSLIIYLMLASGIITVISGLMVYNEGWFVNLPEFFQGLHFYAAWTWLGLVVMHVTGVIVESIVHKDNLIEAMITGFKRRSERNEK